MDFFDYDFNITQLVFVCKVPAGTGDAVHNNRPSHGLAFHLGGERKYIFDNKITLTVKSNDIIFLPEESNYIVETNCPGDCYAINFKISENVIFEPLVWHTKNSLQFNDMFVSAEKAFKAKQNGYLLKCKAELYSIIYLIIKEYNIDYIGGRQRQMIAPALEYIHKTYTDGNISIEYLSMLCNMKGAYFRRIFSKCFGISPVKYINNLKLLRAKELLSQTAYRLEDIAELSGFNNIFWFCRFFKKETGLTPSDYRNANTTL